MTFVVALVCFVFLARVTYAAKFQYKNRLEQPYYYDRTRRILRNASYLTILFGAIAALAERSNWLAVVLSGAPAICMHFLGAINYSRAVKRSAEERMSDGQFKFPGTPEEREKAAMDILSMEIRAGESK